MLPLVAFFGALALALVLVVAAASSLYLEKKRLFTFADGAALVGAESFRLEQVARSERGWRPTLTSDEVRAAVGAFVADQPRDEFRELVVERAGSADGRSATVTLSAVWHPPVITVFAPDGLRIEATATARSVFD